ncbi:hypothetical protein Gotri_018794 [Gossypium trilobum]|uniref:Uncharacterized protein n=1 Tax=Gossypium trilobum TaxID=34281 RepID=A0A7J9EB48_9ROSI|nr:hypothetical protein [Gossypium trilobum]
MDPNRDLVEKDCLRKVGEGKKRLHSSLFSQVSAELDLGKASDGHNHVHVFEISTSSARSALDDYDLLDMGYEGQWFTWEDGKFPQNNILESLDRGVPKP